MADRGQKNHASPDGGQSAGNARTQPALRRLTEAFAKRAIVKIYRALVRGVGLPAERTIDVPIGRAPYAPTGALYAATADGAPSRSVCRLLHEDHTRIQSIVEVRIITGRAHQIRIHMAAIGHPLVGDLLYVAGGVPAPLIAGQRPPLPGDCGYHLHATRLAFPHPTNGESVELFSPPPAALRKPDELG
jgi:23S rRNA pseudouridine1911/1915/1917 synthase